MFKLIKESNETVYKKVRIDSQAYTLGDLVMLDRTADAIDVVPATAATTSTNVFAVAMETVASNATEILVCIVDASQEWTVGASNTPTLADNYQKMLLANKSEVNNTHSNNTTDEAVFLQTGVIGAVADKVIVGNILRVATVTA